MNPFIAKNSCSPFEKMNLFPQSRQSSSSPSSCRGASSSATGGRSSRSVFSSRDFSSCSFGASSVFGASSMTGSSNLAFLWPTSSSSFDLFEAEEPALSVRLRVVMVQSEWKSNLNVRAFTSLLT